jgi:hypothetical protein
MQTFDELRVLSPSMQKYRREKVEIVVKYLKE